jgi:hypothetical protein
MMIVSMMRSMLLLPLNTFKACNILIMFRNLVLLLTFFAGSSAFVVAPSTRLGTSLAVAVDTSDIKNGMTIEIDGEPHKVLSFSIMKQARGAAKTTIKFKNLERGNTIENTYRSGEKFETAMIERVDAQFTFQEGVRIVMTQTLDLGLWN